ncbi:MAG: family tricarboxylate transporter, receptor protein [Mycobacterium sp.]|nr:family tricarboxylate transporter, receptor protein [Mycobacterium sp.]
MRTRFTFRRGVQASVKITAIAAVATLALSACAREADTSSTEAVDNTEMSAEQLEQVWAGKTIRFICSESAGGSLDTTSRALARHLGKHLPGDPRVVVENMEGGESRIATNYIYSAEPNGLVIGMTDINIPFYSLLGEGEAEGVRWDPNNINWLGSTSKAPQVLAIHSRTGIDPKDLDAIRAANIKLPYGAVGDGPHTGHVLINEVLDLNLQPVFGYGGSTERMLGLDRGEVDGTVSTWDSLKRQKSEELANGTLVPVLQIGGPIDDPVMAGVPTLADLIASNPQEDKDLLGVVADRYEWARPIMAPNGTNATVLEALRTGVAETLADPEFLAEAQTLGIDIDPATGPEVTDRVTEYLQLDTAAVTRLQDAIGADGS